MKNLYYVIRGFLISAGFYPVTHWRDLNPKATYPSAVYLKDENCHSAHDWAMVMPMGIANAHRWISYEYAGRWLVDVNEERWGKYHV